VGLQTLEQRLADGRELADAGRKAEAVAALSTAAHAASDPADAATLLVEATYLALWVYGPDRALELSSEAELLVRGDGSAAEVRALTRLGDALLWCGRYQEAKDAWARAAVVPAPSDASLLCERANALLRSGQVAASRETAYEAVVAARRDADRVVVLDALGLACVADIHSGGLREALLCAEQAVALAGSVAGLSLLDALGLLAWVTALQGDVDRCHAVLTTAREVGGQLPMTAPGGMAEGMLAMCTGEWDTAVHAFEAKLRELRISVIAQSCGPRPYVPSLIEAYARSGREAEARSLVDEVLPAALETEEARIIAPVLRAEAVAYADVEAFVEARRWHESWGNLFEEGRTLLAEGELLRRNKQREQARTALRAAYERFEHVGAMTWAARASAELRVAGDRSAAVPTPIANAAVRLTQQEAAVVDLVQAGLSNRELAAQLFLSIKTVERHLTAIYGKYGVRSRSQLLAKLSSRTR
jgi:ATP/maltotriose-dependent transcriptional regulator MalT